jgi:hypothetical protein
MLLIFSGISWQQEVGKSFGGEKQVLVYNPRVYLGLIKASALSGNR